MNKNVINVAVDSGYGYALGKSKERIIRLSNYILKVDETFVDSLRENLTELSEDKILVKYKDNYYAIGELATRLDDSVNRYISNNRVGDLYHTLEIITTLALTTDLEKFSVNLILGLPNKLAYLEKALQEDIKGDYEIEFIQSNGDIKKSFSVNNNVVVIPQPLAPIFNLKPEGIPKYQILSIDIGHGTLDAFVLRKGIKSINRKEYMCIEGVSRCYSKLEEKLIEKYREEYGIMNIENIRLQEAIEENVFRFKNQQIDIIDINKVVFGEYAEYIFHELENCYGDNLGKFDIIIGSGAIMSNAFFVNCLSNLLSQYKVTFKVLGNPQESIVNGMFNIINSKFKEEVVNEG